MTFDRRSQRIRDQLRQHANPRKSAANLPFSEQMRRVYQPATDDPSTSDHHAQLARQLATQRKRR